MGFFNIVKGLLKSSKKDILDLIEKRRIEFNPDVFVNPAKYTRPLATEKIVADKKFSRQGVDFYKQKIIKREKVDPIIVVKHCNKHRKA